MALYRGATKLAGIGKGFSPENSGTEGQVLTKTSTGYAFCDSQGGGGNNGYLDLILVGGGGGGGNGSGNYPGGGGGGGEVIELFKYPIELGKGYYVCVGAGGGCGINGGDSEFELLKAYGGGAGGSPFLDGCSSNGNGGGGGSGSLNTNCARVPKGGKGKNGGGSSGAGYYGGGGGSAGGVGASPSSNNLVTLGGSPVFSKILGEFIAAGGSGGTGETNTSNSKCRTCGWNCKGNGGTCNTAGCKGGFIGGGGGGGGKGNCGGCGEDGIVTFRYKTDGSCGINCATGGTVTTSGDYTIHTFTSDGTFCIVC